MLLVCLVHLPVLAAAVTNFHACCVAVLYPHRDYVRVAGPGVYVGCAYLPGPLGKPTKDDCVFFMLVRTPSAKKNPDA